jgi:hypothetical protein
MEKSINFLEFQYYHTVTAVRRADVSRSPMLKVMDLFRHRSNSAVSEADKRKAVSFFSSFFPFIDITATSETQKLLQLASFHYKFHIEGSCASFLYCSATSR